MVLIHIADILKHCFIINVIYNLTQPLVRMKMDILENFQIRHLLSEKSRTSLGAATLMCPLV